MCWHSNSIVESKRAEKGMTVWKIMKQIGGTTYVKSYYQKMKYKIGRLYETEMNIKFNDFVSLGLYLYPMSITEGFHSYNPKGVKFTRTQFFWDMTKKGLDDRDDRLDIIFEDPYAVVVECVIPEGSTYYENDRGEIVSDKIIITDKIIKRFNHKG